MLSKNLTENADAAASLLALLGNGKRLIIVGYLLDRELSVGTLAEKVHLSQSALSQHLAKLRAQDLVRTRRDRQMIYYSCHSDDVRNLLKTLEDIYAGDEDKGSDEPREHSESLRRSGT